VPERVLITGGAGFIGCALARRLVERGRRVVVLDALHPQIHAYRVRPAALVPGAELIIGDVTDPDAVAGALSASGAEVVVHLAAETGTGQSLRAASRHGLVNVVGTTRLLDAITEAGHPVGHIVLASSRAVYGEGQWRDGHGTVFSPGSRPRDALVAGRWDPTAPDGGTPTPEPHRAGTTPTEPVSVYGATKLAQEHVLGAWCAATGVALTVLRLQNVYGPGQSLTNPYAGVLTAFARTAFDDRVIDVYEDGGIGRDFVYVDDAARALADAVDRPPEGRRTLDIGSGATTSLLAVAGAIAAAAGAPMPIVSGRFRAGDVRSAGCDIGPAAHELAYCPRWTIESGLTALLAHVGASAPAPERRLTG
jgi:dTDP-L-rhamnose 4-epimerase